MGRSTIHGGIYGAMFGVSHAVVGPWGKPWDSSHWTFHGGPGHISNVYSVQYSVRYSMGEHGIPHNIDYGIHHEMSDVSLDIPWKLTGSSMEVDGSYHGSSGSFHGWEVPGYFHGNRSRAAVAVDYCYCCRFDSPAHCDLESFQAQRPQLFLSTAIQRCFQAQQPKGLAEHNDTVPSQSTRNKLRLLIWVTERAGVWVKS